jgi:hypothetical protein
MSSIVDFLCVIYDVVTNIISNNEGFSFVIFKKVLMSNTLQIHSDDMGEIHCNDRKSIMCRKHTRYNGFYSKITNQIYNIKQESPSLFINYTHTIQSTPPIFIQ